MHGIDGGHSPCAFSGARRLASRQALAWLRESYWELQESYLRKSRERVRAAIAAYHAERVEGLARARQAPTTPVLETLGALCSRANS